MCGITHSHVWRDSFICLTWINYMCGMTHSYVWHHLFMCVVWLICLCDMTHWYIWHICAGVTWPPHIQKLDPCPFPANLSHPYTWHDAKTWHSRHTNVVSVSFPGRPDVRLSRKGTPVLQCFSSFVAVCCSASPQKTWRLFVAQRYTFCVLQCVVAVFCSVLQCVAVCVTRCIAVHRRG